MSQNTLNGLDRFAWAVSLALSGFGLCLLVIACFSWSPKIEHNQKYMFHECAINHTALEIMFPSRYKECQFGLSICRWREEGPFFCLALFLVTDSMDSYFYNIFPCWQWSWCTELLSTLSNVAVNWYPHCSSPTYAWDAIYGITIVTSVTACMKHLVWCPHLTFHWKTFSGGRSRSGRETRSNWIRQLLNISRKFSTGTQWCMVVAYINFIQLHGVMPA